jgi:hypothetical protein
MEELLKQFFISQGTPKCENVYKAENVDIGGAKFNYG